MDPFYLSWKAKEYDFHTRFIELAGEINIGMPYHVSSAVVGALNQRRKRLMDRRYWYLAWRTKTILTIYGNRPLDDHRTAAEGRGEVSYQ